MISPLDDSPEEQRFTIYDETMFEKEESTQLRIARLAGVSQSSVSMALKGKGSLSKDTRERILEMAKLLEYSPISPCGKIKKENGLPSTLRFGISLPDKVERQNRNSFYSQIINGIISEISRSKVEFIPFDIQSDSLKGNFPSVDGIIFFDSKTLHHLQVSHLTSLPLVSILTRMPFISQVNTDQKMIVDLAMSYLHEMGHRKIAFIGEQSHQGRKRFGYFELFFREKSMLLDQDWICFFPKENYWDQCEMILKKLYASTNRPTAIFAWNDTVALGILKTALEIGVKIPEDISIISADGIYETSFSSPPLTTVSLNLEALGSSAVVLLKKFVETSSYRADEVTVEPRLIIRESVKNLNPKIMGRLIIKGWAGA